MTRRYKKNFTNKTKPSIVAHFFRGFRLLATTLPPLVNSLHRFRIALFPIQMSPNQVTESSRAQSRPGTVDSFLQSLTSTQPPPMSRLSCIALPDVETDIGQPPVLLGGTLTVKEIRAFDVSGLTGAGTSQPHSLPTPPSSPVQEEKTLPFYGTSQQ